MRPNALRIALVRYVSGPISTFKKVVSVRARGGQSGDRAKLLNWRRERDSNPRRAFDPYTLSRGAPSTARPSLRALGTLVCQLAGGCPGCPPCGAAMILKRLVCGKALAPSAGEPCAHERLHRLERRIERLGFTATGLRKIRPTAAATAHLRSHRTGQLAGLYARGLVRGDPHYQQHLRGVLDT